MKVEPRRCVRLKSNLAMNASLGPPLNELSKVGLRVGSVGKDFA
jgi:hypothetical protein